MDRFSLPRTKLGLGPSNGYRLTSIYGYGYRLEQVAIGDARTRDYLDRPRMTLAHC